MNDEFLKLALRLMSCLCCWIALDLVLGYFCPQFNLFIVKFVFGTIMDRMVFYPLSEKIK